MGKTHFANISYSNIQEQVFKAKIKRSSKRLITLGEKFTTLGTKIV